MTPTPTRPRSSREEKMGTRNIPRIFAIDASAPREPEQEKEKVKPKAAPSLIVPSTLNIPSLSLPVPMLPGLSSSSTRPQPPAPPIIGETDDTHTRPEQGPREQEQADAFVPHSLHSHRHSHPAPILPLPVSPAEETWGSLLAPNSLKDLKSSVSLGGSMTVRPPLLPFLPIRRDGENTAERDGASTTTVRAREGGTVGSLSTVRPARLIHSPQDEKHADADADAIDKNNEMEESRRSSRRDDRASSYTRQLKAYERELRLRLDVDVHSERSTEGSVRSPVVLAEREGIDEVPVEWCFYCKRERERDQMELIQVALDKYLKGADEEGEKGDDTQAVVERGRKRAGGAQGPEEGEEGKGWQWVCGGGCGDELDR